MKNAILVSGDKIIVRMIWRVILFWLLAANLAWADLPCHSFIASVCFRRDQTVLLNYWGHPLDGYAYISDSWGLRTNITRQLGLSTNIVTTSFDGIGQLMTWSGRETNGTLRQNEQLAYALDAAGNLNCRTNGAMIQTFTVNTLNQISNVTRTGTFTVTGATPAPVISVTVNGAVAQTNSDFTFASPGYSLANGNNTFTIIARNMSNITVTNSLTVNLPTPVSFQYDANGNLTNDGARWFFYDAENQLTNVTSASQWQVVFVYDGLNRRRIERDYTWTNNAWLKTNETRFLYDGMQVIQERDTNNNPVATYTRGLDLSMSLTGAGGIGGLLARTDANGSTFFHSDANGNVTALMDGNQNIVARYEYDGFLRVIGRWGTMAAINRMGASSMPLLGASGLVGYWRREYDPVLSRWISADPAGEAGGENLYRFAGGNPINNIDPYGLINYESWPFIGPIVSNARLNDFARQHSDDQGNSFQNYNDMKRYLDEKRHYFNPQYQSGDISTVQGIADVTGAAAEGEMNFYGAILAGGIVSKEAEEALQATRLGEDCPKYPKLGYKGTAPYRGAMKLIQKGGTHVDLGFIPTEAQARELLEDAGVDMSKIRVQDPHSAPNPHTYPHINYPTPSGGKGTIQIQ
jgi:RHS repeat-associated protein